MKKEESGLVHLFPLYKVNTLDYSLQKTNKSINLITLQKYEKKLIANLVRT